MSPRDRRRDAQRRSRSGSARRSSSSDARQGRSGSSRRSSSGDGRKSRAGSQRRSSDAKPARRGSKARTGARRDTPTARSSERSDRRRAGHDRFGGEWVEGRQAVRELLLAGRRKTHEILLAEGLAAAAIVDDIRDLAAELHVPVRTISVAELDARSHTDAPQGVIARAAGLPAVDLESLLQHRTRVGTVAAAPYLVAVDRVTDPRNLGALLRIAECAGATGFVIPRHRNVAMTPTVAKAAAGAIEWLPIAAVAGLPTAIARMKAAGLWVVGLDAASEGTVWNLATATEPLCLVLGAEGSGLSRLVRQRCDHIVAIPIGGRLSSLNVAAAAAIACFEVGRLRRST